MKRAVGWSARSPEECIRAADGDQTIRTALLDGARAYAAEVRGGSFPGPEHSFQQDRSR